MFAIFDHSRRGWAFVQRQRTVKWVAWLSDRVAVAWSPGGRLPPGSEHNIRYDLGDLTDEELDMLCTADRILNWSRQRKPYQSPKERRPEVAPGDGE
jgi:hypothetical protein